MYNVLDIPKVFRRYSQKSVRFVHPIIKTVRTVCPSRISPYDLSKLLCLFPYTICLPYDMSADREKKILYMTLISTPPEGAGASESESLFSLVLRRLLAAWRKRLAAFNGKGLFTYYVSRNWGLSDPPSPLRQQLSAFTVPPPPPPAADVICEQPLKHGED